MSVFVCHICVALIYIMVHKHLLLIPRFLLICRLMNLIMACNFLLRYTLGVSGGSALQKGHVVGAFDKTPLAHTSGGPRSWRGD